MLRNKNFKRRHYVSFLLYLIWILIIERKTIVFDFDETLAKVHFNKRELPHYDDQVDILTKDKTISVTLLNYNLIANRYSLVCDLG
jgi:hypothetical protein